MMDVALENSLVLTQADYLRMTEMCLRLQLSDSVEEKRDLVFNLILEIPRHADAGGAVTLMSDTTVFVDKEIETDTASMQRVMTFLFPTLTRN